MRQTGMWGIDMSHGGHDDAAGVVTVQSAIVWFCRDNATVCVIVHDSVIVMCVCVIMSVM